MQENTHVYRCLVAEESAGVFHSRGAGAWTARATDKKERKDGPRKPSLTMRRSFASPSPSGARVAVSNFSSMTRTDVQDQRRIFRRCCCRSLTTAKWCRSCWWPFRVVGYVIVSKHGIQVGRLRTPLWASIYIFPLNITASEVLPANNHFFSSLAHQTWRT